MQSHHHQFWREKNQDCLWVAGRVPEILCVTCWRGGWVRREERLVMRLWGGWWVGRLKGGRILLAFALPPDNLLFTYVRENVLCQKVMEKHFPRETRRRKSLCASSTFSSATSHLFRTDNEDHYWWSISQSPLLKNKKKIQDCKQSQRRHEEEALFCVRGGDSRLSMSSRCSWLNICNSTASKWQWWKTANRVETVMGL